MACRDCIPHASTEIWSHRRLQPPPDESITSRPVAIFFVSFSRHS
ncbi:hypothetical protein LINGRAHAP2_LOCUS19709 [Linum grandiflorum]